MMLREINSHLDQITPNNVKLFFISRYKENSNYEYVVYKTQITNEIGQEFIEILKKNINKYLKLDNLEYNQYNPMVIMEKNNIEYIEKGDVVHFKIIKSELKKINLDLFDLEETKKLWAFAIKFGSELIYFRKYTENKILDKKPLLALFVSDGAFNKLDKSVITIDQKVDCIYYKEKIYILNKNQFEQIFSFLEKLMDEIDESYDRLVQKSLVDDEQILYDLCKTDPKKVKKLNKVLKGDIIDTLDYDKVNQLNNQYNLELEFTDDNKMKIQRKNIWTILKVLDDDYLKSPVTDIKYEAHSKIKMG